MDFSKHSFLVFLFIIAGKVLGFHPRKNGHFRDSQLNGDHVIEDEPPTDSNTTERVQTSCPGCAERREQIKLMQIERVKQTILSTLNMQIDRLPNASIHNIQHNSEVKRLIDGYANSMTNIQRDEEVYRTPEPSSTIEKMILFPKRPIQEWGSTESSYYSFQFADRLFEYSAKQALLHIHLHRASGVEGSHKILINRVYPRSDQTRKPRVKLSIEQDVSLDESRGQWVIVDVTSIAQEWLLSPREDHIIQIKLVDGDGNLLNHLMDTSVDTSHSKRSYIILDVKKKYQRRVRRQAGENVCTEDNPQESCCMYPLEVNFEKIQWDWVIVPRSFYANFCDGTCSLEHRPRYSHTYLTSSFRFNVPGTGPCCSPNQMGELHLLYFDVDDNIQVNRVPNMSVQSCRCA